MFRLSKPSSSHSHGTLPSFLIGSALLGASALSLSAGSAEAVTVCTFSNFVGCINQSAIVGDKEITVLLGPTLGSGKVDFTQDNGFWQVDVDFDPLLRGPVGEIEYKLQILEEIDPVATFDKVFNQWSGSGANVTKLVYSDPFETEIARLTGDGQVATLPSGLKEIWVADFYTVQPGGELDSFQNLYTQTVPGPLPLLGAGTAFGFSRRLRRRLKQRHSLG